MSFKSFQQNIRESDDNPKLCIAWMFCISIATVIFFLESPYLSWIPKWNTYIVFYILGTLFFVVWMISLDDNNI